MKRNLFTYIVVMLVAGLTLVSCLSSNEADYSSYQDCDITSFSVGDISTTRHTKTAAGKDSTYTVTVSGDSITWAIDQLNGRIYNPDSLPVGTNVTKVVATISANGLVARDSLGTLLYFGNGTDSLDFSKEQKFRVIAYANANKGDYNANYRSYQVEIRVHKMDANKWTWDSIPANQAAFPGTSFTSGQKAVELGGKIFVFGTNGTTVSVASSSNGLNWTAAQALTGMASIDYSTVLADTDENKFYGKAADGTLCVSSDGINWSAAFSGADKISTLLYKENNTIYAASDGKLVSIGSNGNRTILDAGGDETYLPAANISRFAFDGTVIGADTRYLFVGTGAASVDTATVSWTKTKMENHWLYIGNSGDNVGQKACPAFNHIAIFAYGTKLVAFGGDNISKGAKQKGFNNVYYSDDWGISWFPSKSETVFPEIFSTDNVRNLSFSYIIKDKKLWIFWSQPVNGAYIWRGYLNKVHFLR